MVRSSWRYMGAVCSIFVFASGCSDSSNDSDGSGADSGGVPDVAVPDADLADGAQPDAGNPDPDAADAQDPDGGFEPGDAEVLPDGQVRLVVGDVQPSAVSISDNDGGPDRPLGAVQLGDGPVFSFVLNELVVQYTDEFELKQWLGANDGFIEETVSLASFDDETQAASFARVTLRSTRDADADFGAAIAQLGPSADVEMSVSSDQAADFLGTAALLAVESVDNEFILSVGINGVGQGGGLPEGSTSDAPSSAGIGWTGDMYDLPWFAETGPTGHGVGTAWTLMANRGYLLNRVRVAILDSGFAESDDFPASARYASSLAFVGNTRNVSNPFNCSGGNPCPWHGTGAALAAAGLPDNGVGAAGTGGPVVDLTLVYGLTDCWTMIAGLGFAAGESAKVVNMSFGIPFPWPLAWSNAGGDLATLIASRSRVLFAAAGNSSRDIDEIVCGAFNDCWESVMWAPCENAGVQCVGATPPSGAGRASYSNFGSRPDVDSVDFWAVGTVPVGMVADMSSTPPGVLMPASGPGDVALYNGTSAASPVAAGMAALVYAVDPTLTPGQVVEILRSTAENKGSGITTFIRVDRAVGSLIPALPSNQPPTVSIGRDTGSGAESAPVLQRVPERFQANAADFEDGAPCCELNWEVTGGLHVISPVEDDPTRIRIEFRERTSYQVSVTATDSSGASTTATQSLVVVPNPREGLVRVIEPVTGATVFTGEPVRLRAEGEDFDRNPLACETFVWQLLLPDGLRTLNGCESSIEFDSPVASVVGIVGVDSNSDGEIDEPQTYLGFTVEDRPAVVRPTAEITSPGDAQTLRSPFEIVNFAANVVNPDGTAIYVGWRADFVTESGEFVTVELDRNAVSLERRLSDYGLTCGSRENVPVLIRLIIETEFEGEWEADRIQLIYTCEPG